MAKGRNQGDGMKSRERSMSRETGSSAPILGIRSTALPTRSYRKSRCFAADGLACV
ncbi:MAG: hypothetical protein AAF721_28300 [Myxococcota bacterium]